MGMSRAGIHPISQAAHVKYEKVKVEVEGFLAELNTFYEVDLDEFKKTVEESGFSLFKAFKPLKLEGEK